MNATHINGNRTIQILLCRLLLGVCFVLGGIIWGALPVQNTLAGEPAGTLDELFRQAVQSALVSSHQQDVEIDHTRIVDNWAIATARTEFSDSDAGPSWNIEVIAGRWDGQQWEIALRPDPEFGQWLEQMPETLVSDEARPYLGSNLSGAAHAHGFWLPFPPGQTWRYVAGPYGGPKREAVAFGPVGQFELVKPQPVPGFTGRERIVTAAAPGLVVARDSNLVIIDHGYPYYQTGYASLDPASIPVEFLDVVAQGQVIGYASTSGNVKFGDHVRFWVRRDGVDEPSEGLSFSNWRIFRDNGFRAGQTAGTLIYKNGSERIDCTSAEWAELPSWRCQVRHFLPFIDPLTTPDLEFVLASPPAIPLGGTEYLFLNISNVEDLYKIALTLKFPAGLLTVVDADPDTATVEIMPGEIFSDKPVVIEKNSVDLQQGTVDFAARFQTPTPAFSGDDCLAKIAFERVAAGDAQIEITSLKIVDANDHEIYSAPAHLIPQGAKIFSAAVLHGQANLQGRDNHGGVKIAADSHQVESNVAGEFFIGVEEGYQLTLDAAGYLATQVSSTDSLIEGQTIDLGQINLLAGDVTGDNVIDIFDLAVVAGNFGQTGSQVDLNQDAIVNIQDIVMIAGNYGRQGPIQLTGAP